MSERQLTLHAPTLDGDQELMVRRIEGREAISELFAYEVTLYAKSAAVDFSKVLGQEMCVGLEQPRGQGGGAEPERFFHGYVASFAYLGAEEGFHLYRAELRPSFWRLTRTVNCRAFQGETVTNIVETILRQLGVTFDAHYSEPSDYKPWEYCVQYRESDFAFISRLLEHEGIHYCFKHEQNKHTLMLSDANPGANEGIKGYDVIEFTQPGNVDNRREESAWHWTRVQRVMPDRTTVKDYDFTEPAKDLLRTSSSEINREHDDARNYEVYDWLETFVQETGYGGDAGERYARIRSTELHTQHDVASFQTDARGLSAGYPFKFKNGPTTHQNRGFLVIATRLSAEIDVRGSSGNAGGEVVYECSVDAIDLNNPYRPQRVTPKPRIPGPQSAIVAGPSGAKNHHTDQWGRVFVKFHWYRAPGELDKNVSFWVRVSQNSAGANWGSMFVPHIGQEVIVSFYEGDPDRPVITGRVYNGSNKPPLDLPAFADKSIIRDHKSNAITLDATDGEEKVRLYSPADHAVFQLGTKGSQIFTRSTSSTYSYDSKSYAFGSKIAYTKGWSFTVDRGAWASIKAGFGVSVTLGNDFKFSGGASAEFKSGIAFSYLMSTSIAWGYGPEFKAVEGTYRRVSKGEAVFDSQTATFVTGAKNDNTMVRLDDQSMQLSFDDSKVNRSKVMDEAFAKAKKSALAAAGLSGTLTTIGAGWYLMDVDAVGPVRTPDEKTEQIVADCDRISGLSGSDALTGLGAVTGAAAAILSANRAKFEQPKHEAPTAKITLKSNTVQIFAGKQKDQLLEMNKDKGITVTAKKKVEVTSEKEIKLVSKSAITIDATNAVMFKGMLKHANWTVAK